MIFSLSPELHKRLCQALLYCVEFDNKIRLQGDLAMYNRVFEDTYQNKEKLVTDTVMYLVQQRIRRIRPALPLFLQFLHDILGEDDALRDELEELHALVTYELDEQIAKSHAQTSTKTTPLINMMLPPLPSPSLPPPDPINEIFLELADREKIIQITIEIIEIMGSDHEGKKSLLRYSGLPDLLIHTIHFDKAPRNVADQVIGYIERRDKQDVSMACLEMLVLNIVHMNYKGTEVETTMKKIIERYNTNRKIYAHKEKYSRYQALLKPEDYVTDQKLQDLRSSYRGGPPQVSSYKIDVSMILQCNLGTQRMCFTTGFNKRFKGFFTFAVASVEYTVLKEYVLGGLLWELKKNNPRPTRVHHISLYPQSIDFSTVEQGSISIQKQIQQLLGGKSLRDVLEDTQDDNLAVVFWITNNFPYNFKDIALLFSETIKQQVSDSVQNRCFILFWATYGPAPIEPLAVSGALPAFERFEVAHIIDWLDVSLSYQLKEQNIPEQEITYWRAELVKKIKYHNGYLPGTYDCLLEPLERGGAF
jgi:hypothetical protein